MMSSELVGESVMNYALLFQTVRKGVEMVQSSPQLMRFTHEPTTVDRRQQ